MSVLVKVGLPLGQGMQCLRSLLHELVMEAVGISVLNLAAGLGWAPSMRSFYLATQWVWTLPFQERAGIGAHEGSWGWVLGVERKGGQHRHSFVLHCTGGGVKGAPDPGMRSLDPVPG